MSGARCVRVVGKLALGHVLVSLVWGIVLFLRPDPVFVGSPPRSSAGSRGDIDFGKHGNFLERFAKMYRPHHLFEWGPGLLLTPIIYQFTGWDTLREDICVQGTVGDISGFSGDGDINFRLIPVTEMRDPLYELYRNVHPERMDSILVEIDDPLWRNFPVLHDIRVGDTLMVCGPLVHDRGHGINEIELHPPRWIQILQR